MGSYRPIAEYGLIGDGYTATLVGPDGSIDWLCWPRFDSPSLFARLLDRAHGGSWRVRAIGSAGDGEMRYIPETAILETDHHAPNGVVQVRDLMLPPARGAAAGATTLLRLLEGRTGWVELESLIDMRPDYATSEVAWEGLPDGCRLTGKTLTARLAITGVEFSAEWVPGAGTRHRFRIDAGQRAALVLAFGAAEIPAAPFDELGHCVDYWRAWCERCRFNGEHRDAVLRSALTLKLLTHTETGAIVAAPTTSLPEQVGGVRNWDYRYTWLRDASLTVYALLATGQQQEAAPFLRWVCDRVGELRDVADLRIMYALDGAADLPERELKHLEGYRGSRPVRVGNAAGEQLQLDVYGEVLNCLALCGTYGLDVVEEVWGDFRRVVDWVADHWQQPDNGIWEIRGGRRHFVYSKVMAWVALDRGARLVEEYGVDGDAGRWREQADRLHAEVLQRGWSERLGAFRQAYELDELDASNLLIPLVGFLGPDDHRVHATIDATLHGLTDNGLVYRYRGVDDGLPGAEATFAICTFWLVSALARCGRRDEARSVFANALAYSGPLGLFAEEIDPRSGEGLGNYPQAFTHLGLIGAACDLLERGAIAASAPATAGATPSDPSLGRTASPTPAAGSGGGDARRQRAQR